MADEQNAVVTAADLDGVISADAIAGFSADNDAGEVGAEWKSLSVTLEGGKKVSEPFLKVYAKTVKGVQLLASGDSDALVEHFNYGFDLSRRGPARQAIQNKFVDVATIIAKAAKTVVAAHLKAGMVVTQETAEKMIKDARVAQGLPIE